MHPTLVSVEDSSGISFITSTRSPSQRAVSVPAATIIFGRSCHTQGKARRERRAHRCRAAHTPHRRTSAGHVLHLLAHHAGCDDWFFSGAITRFDNAPLGRAMGGGRARGTICWGGECGRDGFCEGCAELCARLAGPSVAGDAIAVGSYGNADRLGRGAQCCPMQSVELRCCREEEELVVAHLGAISHAGSLWHMRLFGGTTRWRFRWRRHGGQDCSARRVLEAASVVQRSRPSSQRPPRQRAAPAAVGARRAAMHIAAGSSPLLCCSQFRSCRALIGAVAVRGPSTHSFRMLTSRFNLQHAMPAPKQN